MIVTSDVLVGVVTNFRAIYEQTFLTSMAQARYPELVMEMPSTTLIESYSWFGTVPEPREWTDTRQDGGLNPFNMQIKNLDFEDTVSVDRNIIEDDRLGIIKPRIMQLGMAYPIFIEKTAITALVNGAVSGNNSYDGVTFYNSAHVIGSAGSQTNLATNNATSTNKTLAYLQTDFSTAKAQMVSFKDDQNRPMGITPTTVLCGPDLEQLFRQLLNASFIPLAGIGSGDNTFKGQANLIVSPYVTADTWHLLATNYPMKPLIFQNRKLPEFVALDRPDDYSAFMKKKFYYGIDFRMNVSYGEWFMAIKVA